MTGTVPRDLDELLAHAGWVRQLSLQLCRDRHAAADAAQEAWLQTLRRRPDARGSARGFLATVLGNVVRMRGRADQRVQRRERAAARRCDLTESAADACARAELQQFVVREVLALPEPQKALVLLHYFEGRAVADLAKRHRITADAVRAHLRRARDTLRQRLQSQDGPARRAFGALLLSHSSSLPWLLVGATMAIGIKTKLLAAAAVIARAARERDRHWRGSSGRRPGCPRRCRGLSMPRRSTAPLGGQIPSALPPSATPALASGQ